MRLSKLSTVVLSTAAAICLGCVAAYSAPSVDGWSLTPIVEGNNVSLSLDLGDVSSFAGYQGTLSRTWGDPTFSDPSRYITLGDSGAFLRSFTVSFDGDPVLTYDISVQAGDSVTNFTLPVVSNVLPVDPAIANARARATAAITVTDYLEGESADGALATGGYAGGKFYRASYNVGSAPQDFAFLIDGPITVDPYYSADRSANTGYWQSLGAPVSDMQTEFKFSLSAHDLASMTSSFYVEPVPEPSSVVALVTGLVGIGGLLRRKRI